jgi:hypothetical protein
VGWFPHLSAPTKVYSHPLVADKSIHPLNGITIGNGFFDKAALGLPLQTCVSPPGKSAALVVQEILSPADLQVSLAIGPKRDA